MQSIAWIFYIYLNDLHEMFFVFWVPNGPCPLTSTNAIALLLLQYSHIPPLVYFIKTGVMYHFLPPAPASTTTTTSGYSSKVRSALNASIYCMCIYQ